MVKFTGTEKGQTLLGGVNDYRERYAYMVHPAVTAIVGHEMELVGVQDVPENNLVGIKFPGVFALFFLLTLVRNMLIVKVRALAKNKHRKKAESRYQ
jgi:hypothetical protein